MKKENHKKEDLYKQPLGRGLGEFFKNMYDAIAKGEDKFTFNDKEHDITESQVAEYFAAIESDTKKNQRFTNDQEQIVMTLVKKIQDEDLDPIEIALTYQRLMNDFGLSLIEIAEYSGTDRSTVTNYIRLLKLDPLIQSGIRNNLISFGHAWSLYTVESTEDQKSIYKEILNKNLSVRQTEYRVNAFRNSDQTIIEILNSLKR